jgi:hypothetical protein
MNIDLIDDLKQFITNLSEDFTDEYLVTPELKQRFIDQVYDYTSNACETDQEMYCFVDGLLMNLYENNNNR